MLNVIISTRLTLTKLGENLSKIVKQDKHS